MNERPHTISPIPLAQGRPVTRRGGAILPRPVAWLTTAKTPREEWLAVRRTGVGGSDVAAILGLSPFASPWDVWAAKTGAVPDPPQQERVAWGQHLEDTVARVWAAQEGHALRRLGMVADPVHPLRMASLDRAVIAPGTHRATALAEIKTTSARSGDLDDDDLLARYETQCRWYLGVTGLPLAHVVVLVGGQRLRTGTVTAAPDWYADTGAYVEEWWHRHVEAGVPPELTALDLDRINGRPADEPPTTATADDQVRQWLRGLASVKQAIAELEDDEKALVAAIGDAMGGATELLDGDGTRLATWRPQTSTRLDTKRLRTDHPDLCADYMTTTTSRPFKPARQKGATP